jgi:hypothetical protein
MFSADRRSTREVHDIFYRTRLKTGGHRRFQYLGAPLDSVIDSTVAKCTVPMFKKVQPTSFLGCFLCPWHLMLVRPDAVS